MTVFEMLYSVHIGLGLVLGLGFLRFMCSYWPCMHMKYGAVDSFFIMHFAGGKQHFKSHCCTCTRSIVFCIVCYLLCLCMEDISVHTSQLAE